MALSLEPGRLGAARILHSHEWGPKRPHTSTPQLPFKIPQIPSNRDCKAPNRGTLGGLGTHKDLTNQDFLYAPHIGPWNWEIGSLDSCGQLGPQCRTQARVGA